MHTKSVTGSTASGSTESGTSGMANHSAPFSRVGAYGPWRRIMRIELTERSMLHSAVDRDKDDDAAIDELFAELSQAGYYARPLQEFLEAECG